MNLYGEYVDKLSKKYIRKNDLVLDCGCGDGFHTSILKRYSDHVIGGDFSNRTDPKNNVHFREIKENEYGKENEFDVVTSFDVIEHVKDDLMFTKELVKITRPGGLLIIGTPNRNRLSHKIRSLIGKKVTYPYRVGYHFESGGDILHLREYTIRDLKDLSSKIANVEIVGIVGSFFGLYTPIGAIGLTGLDQKLFAEYTQHLFLILRKVPQKS